tara:strand:+ start:892 stop:1071 length:180 start_codon:yes stop_codon:yes gene_type:complete
MQWKSSQKARGLSNFLAAFAKMSGGLGLALSTELALLFLFLPMLTLILIASGQHSAVYE